jgi:hypothetical protein
MSVLDAIKDIEHPGFAARVGLANSFRAFLRNISDEPSVVELLALTQARVAAQQVFERIISLSKIRGDIRFLHRFDIPLATYLWVLSRTSPDLARAGAEAAAYLPRTWWTEQVSNFILGEWSQKSIVSSTGRDVISGGVAHLNTNTSNVASSSSVFFPESPIDFEPEKESVRIDSKASTETFTAKAEDENSLLYTTRSDPQEKPE